MKSKFKLSELLALNVGNEMSFTEKEFKVKSKSKSDWFITRLVVCLTPWRLYKWKLYGSYVWIKRVR